MKTVALTFDDGVKSHLDFVVPLLKELGFGASFFATRAFMDNRENFLDWEGMAEIEAMGFEIGNHSWTHGNFAGELAGNLGEELGLVERELEKVGIPKPCSFAWPGNNFNPDLFDLLSQMGYRYARRGKQPEIKYGSLEPGPLFDPSVYPALAMPTTGDSYPEFQLEHFQQTVDLAEDGKAVIMQFHGVPDITHPWVDTEPEKFRSFMNYLKDGDFNVVALRDLNLKN